MAINRTFTGEGTATRFGTSDGLNSAQQRMNNLMMSANKLRYDTFKENQSKFLQMSDVPLETYLSSAYMETQAKLIDKYNKVAEGLLKERGGSFESLTTQDWIELQKGRKFLESEQERMNTDLLRFKEMDKTITSNPQKWDNEKWKEIKLKYMNSGRLDDVEMPIMPASIDLLLNAKKLQGSSYSQVVPVPNNPAQQQQIDYSATEDEAIPYVARIALADPQYLEEAKREWEALTPKEQADFFDSNNETTKRYTALGVTNPVLMNYAKNHASKAIERTPRGTEFKDRATGSGSQFNWNLGIGAGNNRNADFTVKQNFEIDTDEGKVSLPDYMDFSGISRTTTDSRRIGTVLIPNGSGGFTEKPLNESARFDIITYSPSTDVMVIQLKDNTSDRTYRAGTNLAVKASDFSDLLERKPFGIYRKPTTQTQTPISTKGKLKFNAVTGKFE